MKLKLFNCFLLLAIVLAGQAEGIIFDKLTTGLNSGINALKSRFGIGESKAEPSHRASSKASNKTSIKRDDLVLARKLVEKDADETPALITKHAHAHKRDHRNHVFSPEAGPAKVQPWFIHSKGTETSTEKGDLEGLIESEGDAKKEETASDGNDSFKDSTDNGFSGGSDGEENQL